MMGDSQAFTIQKRGSLVFTALSRSVVRGAIQLQVKILFFLTLVYKPTPAYLHTRSVVVRCGKMFPLSPLSSSLPPSLPSSRDGVPSEWRQAALRAQLRVQRGKPDWARRLRAGLQGPKEAGVKVANFHC